MTWNDLGYYEDGFYRTPCVRNVEERPGYRIVWEQTMGGGYTFTLSCKGIPGYIVLSLPATYGEYECPPESTVRGVEARLISAGDRLFAP